MSKFLPSEFVPYRDWFQGEKGLKGTKDQETFLEFRKAVDKHYKRNSGHHWRQFGGPNDTTLKNRLESLADWYSVGKTNNFPDSDNFKQWYYSRRAHLPIDQQTKNEVERILSGSRN